MSNQGEWTDRMYNQHKVCCEQCYDNHRRRSDCKPTHEGTLIVLAHGSGRPKGSKKGTATVPALVLQDNTFLPEMRLEFEGNKPTNKMLRDHRIDLCTKEVAQQQQHGAQWQALQGQSLVMHLRFFDSGAPQNVVPNMLLGQATNMAPGLAMNMAQKCAQNMAPGSNSRNYRGYVYVGGWRMEPSW
ncbi:hypothetical protein FPOAC2_06327 [Fusarium poae]